MRFHAFSVRMVALVLIGSFVLLAPALPTFAAGDGNQQQSAQAPADSGGWLKALVDWVESAVSQPPGDNRGGFDPIG